MSSSRIRILMIAFIIDIFILSFFLSFGTKAASSSEPEDIVGINRILDQIPDDSSRNGNIFESIWKSFKETIDHTRKNVLQPASSSSSLLDNSSVEDESTNQIQRRRNDDTLLNRRVHLMEQSLNEHYTHLLVDSFPDLTNYDLLQDDDGKLTLLSNTNTLNDNSIKTLEIAPESAIRWRYLDTLARETNNVCYCFSQTANSFWSFQWCPHQQIIYQGRREPNGMLQRTYNLGSGSHLPIIEGVQKRENGKILETLGDAHRLTTSARSTYPLALEIHPYVGGDDCFEGSSQRRVSVIIFHESTSPKCFEKEWKELMIESVDEVRVCQYHIHICKSDNSSGRRAPSSSHNLMSDSITESDATMINQTLQYIRNHVTGSYARKSRADSNNKSRDSVLMSLHSALPPLPPTRIEANLKLINEMFMHAYDSYMYNGYPSSEVKPISCKPASFSLVKIPGLTLIDSLDTLVILGNYTEFARAVERLRHLNEKAHEIYGSGSIGRGLFNSNQNVSVFETNIRVLGGLLSAHQLANAFLANKIFADDVWADDKTILFGSHRGKREIRSNGKSHPENFGSDCTTTSSTLQCKQDNLTRVESLEQTNEYWIYDGFLLELAEDIGNRLLPAFNTITGIPYGTVNLRSGIPKGETSVASLAGGGTLSIEMELLGRLTGNREYGRAAKLAVRALWMRRSPMGILGKHICTHKGEWTETLSGIGSNSDSFYEYLIKHHILFPEDSDFWLQLVSAYGGVHNESRIGEWYGDVDMSRGRLGHGAPRKVLEALMAFYPGMQVLLGEIAPAARTLNSFFLVREFLGFLPERFHYGSWKVDPGGGNHLLRPELLESAYFLHRSSKGFQHQYRSRFNHSASDTSGWLWSGDFALNSIEKLTRTKCGYGSLRDVSPDTSGKLNADKNEVKLLDEMPSYFLSETLKYLYLLFDDKNLLHTDEERDWVFTTEAHPIHHEEEDESIDKKLLKQKEDLKIRIQRRLDGRMKPVKDIQEDLLQERWTEASQMGVFFNQLHPLITEDSKAYKIRRDVELDLSRIKNSFSSVIGPLLPHSYSLSSYFDVYNERQQMLNPAYLTFQKLGKGAALTNSCPNLYASNYLWIRALNGGITDYSDTYKSRIDDDIMVSEIDSILLGSADALALYGTGAHIKSFHEVFFKCPIEDMKKRNQRNTADIINGKKKDQSSDRSTRLEMDGVGSFEVSAFPGGSGFFVSHLDSGETLTTTLIENDLTVYDKGPLLLVYSRTDSIDLDNGSLILEDKSNQPSISPSHNPRTVILADLHGNSFLCAIEIVETKITHYRNEESVCNEEIDNNENAKNIPEEFEEKILGKFPCSPALFGPTHISYLQKVKNVRVEAALQVPADNDEHGCGRQPSKLPIEEISWKQFVSTPVTTEDNEALLNFCPNEIISTVRRGRCTFEEKSYNQKNTNHAKGVIVINNNGGDELFVMSGSGSEKLSKNNFDAYPVTVLVTFDDGQQILQLSQDFENNINSQLNARISLVHDEVIPPSTESKDAKLSSSEATFWPRVTASNEALQIYSKHGFGVHAAQTMVDNDTTNVPELQWQIYLLKHEFTK